MATRSMVSKLCLAAWLPMLTGLLLLLHPGIARAEASMALQVLEELDLSALRGIKASASIRLDRQGNLVANCLNLFSIPVGRPALSESNMVNRMFQRSQLRIEQKGRGFMVRLAVAL